MLRTVSPDLISLHASAARTEGGAAVALCAALPLPEADAAPEWIHLLPAGSIATDDGRGPYKVADAAKLVEASLTAMNGAGIVDENHATDLAMPRGDPAPARGWIKALDVRADGIWGKVDWTESGKALMADKAYRHVSPVITHRPDGTVTAILRASLVNRPNLRGLAALHASTLKETSMDFLEKLRAKLGLAADATEDAILAAIQPATALQAALGPIAKAAGLAETADATAVLAGVEALKSAEKGDGTAITALQAALTDVTGQFNTLRDKTVKKEAEAFVDGAIAAGKVGVKPLRDDYVAMHMADPAKAEKMIGALPSLNGTIITDPAPANGDAVSLNASEKAVAKMLGVSEDAYLKTKKAEREAA